MDCQHQEPNCEHFRKFSTSEYNRWNRLRYYVTKFLMNDVSSSDFQIHIVPIARLEAFRPLKASKLEAFRGLKPYSQIGGF